MTTADKILDERRYRLRLKDDFAVRDTVLAMHPPFLALRAEVNRLLGLHEQARHTSYGQLKDAALNAATELVLQLRAALTPLALRALRHKDWDFILHTDPTRKSYTGLMLYVDRHVGSGRGSFTFQVMLTGRAEPHRTTIIIEW